MSSSFKKKQTQEQSTALKQQIVKQFPGVDESEINLLASISGLLARVAFVDMVFTDEEKVGMQQALKSLFPDHEQHLPAIVELAINNAKELSGIEDHLYSEELNKRFSEDERYRLLEILFQVAASDGVADNYESEEIRIICKSLLLTPQHYIAARATVRNKLGALKN